MGRGIPQGGGNVLQGGGSVYTTVLFRDVDPFGSNEEEGGRDAHWVPYTDHGEAIAAVRRRDVGDSWGGRSVVGSRNAADDDLYREMAGNCDAVGGSTPTI